MFTVLGRDIDKKLSKNAGALGHFIKPFTAEELSVSIKAYLKKSRRCKFSKQLGIEHKNIQGKKILLEFDPSSQYCKLIRDFSLECASQKEFVIVLTHNGSIIQETLKNDEDIKIINLPNEYTMLTPIIEENLKEPLSLIYDSLTDLSLLTDHKTVYKFTLNALNLLSKPSMTALFMLNYSAHDPKELYSIKGLFNNQIFFNEEGTKIIKFFC